MNHRWDLGLGSWRMGLSPLRYWITRVRFLRVRTLGLGTGLDATSRLTESHAKENKDVKKGRQEEDKSASWIAHSLRSKSFFQAAVERARHVKIRDLL